MTRGYYHSTSVQEYGGFSGGGLTGNDMINVSTATNATDTLRRVIMTGFVFLNFQGSAGPSAPAPAVWTEFMVQLCLWCDKGEAGQPAGVGAFSHPSIAPVWQAVLTPSVFQQDPTHSDWFSVIYPVGPGGMANTEATRAGRNSPGDHAPRLWLSLGVTSSEGPPILGFPGAGGSSVFVGMTVSTDAVWFAKS